MQSLRVRIGQGQIERRENKRSEVRVFVQLMKETSRSCPKLSTILCESTAPAAGMEPVVWLGTAHHIFGIQPCGCSGY